MARDFDQLFSSRPVVLAPMEDVSDAVFRALCRSVGAEVCVTEFVNVESLVAGCHRNRRKFSLGEDDSPTGIQIYGSNPETLIEAARIADETRPAFIDLNCGCWIPRIAARGAGAGWLRDPQAMVEMATRVAKAVSVPVTVKTRIGLGPESEMPIIDLARRLEDAGVRALAIHCRTAQAGHQGAADWSWAARAQQAVRIPVLVNGDIRTADDVVRAFQETGCAGVMVGRGALDHPWIFREARALLDGKPPHPPPSIAERFDFCRRQAVMNVRARNESNGVQCLRRHLRGYFGAISGGHALRERMNRCDTLAGTLALLGEAEQRISDSFNPTTSLPAQSPAPSP